MRNRITLTTTTTNILTPATSESRAGLKLASRSESDRSSSGAATVLAMNDILRKRSEFRDSFVEFVTLQLRRHHLAIVTRRGYSAIAQSHELNFGPTWDAGAALLCIRSFPLFFITCVKTPNESENAFPESLNQGSELRELLRN